MLRSSDGPIRARVARVQRAMSHGLVLRMCFPTIQPTRDDKHAIADTNCESFSFWVSEAARSVDHHGPGSLGMSLAAQTHCGRSRHVNRPERTSSWRSHDSLVLSISRIGGRS